MAMFFCKVVLFSKYPMNTLKTTLKDQNVVDLRSIGIERQATANISVWTPPSLLYLQVDVIYYGNP